MMRTDKISRCMCLATMLLAGSTLCAADKPQYEVGEFRIPPATAEEPVRSEISVHAARG